MKIERPRFELSRVYSDGTREKPEIISVGQMPWDAKMERRGFLGVGVGVASLLLLLDGKATAQVTTSTTNQTNNTPVRVPDKIIKAHKNWVRSLDFSPDGKILASGSDDNTIKLWSLLDGKLLATLERREYSAYALASSPDAKILAALADDKTVKLWSMPDNKLLATFEGHQEKVESFDISRDRKILASGSSDAIKLWSLAEGKLLATLEGDMKGVRKLVSSRDGKILASRSGTETIKVRSIPDGKLLATLKGNNERYEEVGLALVISPDGRILASSSGDSRIKLWSLPDGKLLSTSERHQYWVSDLAISPDGKILVSGPADDTLTQMKLWSLPEGKLLATLEGHKTFKLLISPDGRILASGSSDKTIKLWSLPDGKLLSTLEGHRDTVTELAITLDGKRLASGDSSGAIILWDLEKRSFLSFLFDPKASQTDAISYNIYDKITGTTLTFTLPCGSPIPPGAVCTCNCVPGTYRPPGPTYSPPGGGTYCSCNKVCTCIPVPSDRDAKEAFETTNPMTILQRLSELPIQKWNYKWDDPSIRHIGPMAQDFAEAFAVGDDDKHIYPVDAQGVAFAAIQGLYQLMKLKEFQNENLQATLDKQAAENNELTARVEALEQLLKKMAAI